MSKRIFYKTVDGKLRACRASTDQFSQMKENGWSSKRPEEKADAELEAELKAAKAKVAEKLASEKAADLKAKENKTVLK